MVKFFTETVKQVLKVFNYKTDSSEKDVIVEYVQSSAETSPGRIKVIFSDSNEIQLQFSAKIRYEFQTRRYMWNIVLTRKSISLRQLNRIWRASVKALVVFAASFQYGGFNKNALSYIVDKAIEDSIISQLLSSDYNDAKVNCISKILSALGKWSNRTYEGRKVPFSFLINRETVNESDISNITSFLDDDASALLTDGITSYLKLDDGIKYCIVPFYDIEKRSADKVPLVPYRFSSFGNLCVGKYVGIILTVQGDFLFIKNQKLFYAKRNGDWYNYNYDSFADTLFDDMPALSFKKGKNETATKTESIKCIYLACLDVAFARTGGCLAVCTDACISKIKKYIRKEDLHGTRGNKSSKRNFLENIIISKKSFYEIDRKSRQELLGIDGATIICEDGKILTTGSIIDNTLPKNIDKSKINAGGGARTKITQKLSLFGIAIKISADGYIECYKEMMNIF